MKRHHYGHENRSGDDYSRVDTLEPMSKLPGSTSDTEE